MKVTAMDLKTKRIFEKEFHSPYLAEKWIKKCKYSKKIRIVGISSYGGVYQGVV